MKTTLSLKWVVAFLASGLGLVALFRYVNRRKVKILLYHGVMGRKQERALNAQGLHLLADRFARHVAYLKAHYRIISLEEAIDGLQGLKPLPAYAVVITFDDGYLNNYEHAWPILRRYQVPATFFVTTSFISSRELLWLDELEYAIHASSQRAITTDLGEGPVEFSLVSDRAKDLALVRLKRALKRMPEENRIQRYREIQQQLDVPAVYREGYFCNPLGWDHVKEMARSELASVGSHAVHHVNLDALEQGQMREEIVQSKAALEERLGRKAALFAYPGGAYNEAIKQALVRAGYRCGVTTRHGFNSRSTDLFELRRNEVGNEGSLLLLKMAASGVFDAMKAIMGRQG